jgi:hypothetical protein
MRIDSYLLDTDILLRLKTAGDADYPIATYVIAKLLGEGASLRTCPRNMIEYRTVATRPLASNGYGLASEDAADDIDDHQSVFPLLRDSDASLDIFDIWRTLVEGAGTVGKANHDTRILALAIATDARTS